MSINVIFNEVWFFLCFSSMVSILVFSLFW